MLHESSGRETTYVSIADKKDRVRVLKEEVSNSVQ